MIKRENASYVILSFYHRVASHRGKYYSRESRSPLRVTYIYIYRYTYICVFLLNIALDISHGVTSSVPSRDPKARLPPPPPQMTLHVVVCLFLGFFFNSETGANSAWRCVHKQLSSSQPEPLIFCMTSDSRNTTFVIECCKEDFCNRDLKPQLHPRNKGTVKRPGSSDDSAGGSGFCCSSLCFFLSLFTHFLFYHCLLYLLHCSYDSPHHFLQFSHFSIC